MDELQSLKMLLAACIYDVAYGNVYTKMDNDIVYGSNTISNPENKKKIGI